MPAGVGWMVCNKRMLRLGEVEVLMGTWKGSCGQVVVRLEDWVVSWCVFCLDVRLEGKKGGH